MRLLLAGLAVLVLGAAFAVGWRTAAGPPEVVAVPARRAPPPVALADPNPRGRFGVQLLAAGLTDPPPSPQDIEAAAVRQQPSPRPPEPDVGEAFRRQLTAVVAQRAGGPYYALLSGEGGRQALKPGDGYLFGWRLAGLDLKQAVFARGRERRSVDLFAAAAPTAEPTPPPAAEPASAEPPAASLPSGGVSEPPLD